MQNHKAAIQIFHPVNELFLRKVRYSDRKIHTPVLYETQWDRSLTIKHIISVGSHLAVGSQQLSLSYLSRPGFLVCLPVVLHLYHDQTVMVAEVCAVIHWCRTQSSFHFLKEHTGSNLLSSQGWIHWVSVLLRSPAYDLFICRVEHSDNPPYHTPNPHLSNQKYWRRLYGDEAAQHGSTL